MSAFRRVSSPSPGRAYVLSSNNGGFGGGGGEERGRSVGRREEDEGHAFEMEDGGDGEELAAAGLKSPPPLPVTPTGLSGVLSGGDTVPRSSMEGATRTSAPSEAPKFKTSFRTRRYMKYANSTK
ncbi:hypothetical protein HK101_011248 [Irineochytrium annulatum]|nr:hypothetical protein HK101_011248 [Irineochytrium annulatum]